MTKEILQNEPGIDGFSTTRLRTMDKSIDNKINKLSQRSEPAERAGPTKHQVRQHYRELCDSLYLPKDLDAIDSETEGQSCSFIFEKITTDSPARGAGPGTDRNPGPTWATR